jgi:outer membrane receptor protein involved in Fe transport
MKRCLLKKISLSLFLFFFFAGIAVSQVTVSGKVTNSENREAIESVSVTEKGTANSTSTDAGGNYTITVKNNATLVFSYVGMSSREIKAGAGGTVNVELLVDNSSMSDVVVSASRQPVRKLETTTAVEIINNKALKTIKPEGIAEAVTAAPGLYVNTSQGRRGGVVTRGFPDGGNPLGGLDYTAILIDGLPSFGSTGRLPESGFGFDGNVEKVEVVRGSAATLYGRASAAGAINVISKTGGEQAAGSVRLTNYNNVFDEGEKNFNFRLDYNVNGAATPDKKLRYNLGGWFLDDKGYKNTGFKDKGYQFRGNLDYLVGKNKGKIRLYFLHGDYIFQNLTDVPADLNTMQIAGKWKNYQTIQNFNAFYNLNYTVYESGGGFPTRRVTTNGTDSIYRNIGRSMTDNSYSRSWQIGNNINLDLGSGFSVENKFRWQKIKSGTKYSFALPSFYLNNTHARLLLDGDASDNDVIDELRLKKYIKAGTATHNLVVGTYLSSTHLLPTTYSFLHVMNPSNPDSLKFAPLAPPFVTTPWSGSLQYPRGSITRRGDYTEKVSSIFAGDEMKFNNKLTVIAGIRYDVVKIDMEERKKPYDSTIKRNVKHNDWSGSIGFNYLLKPNTAIYGNFTRAFRAPDYTAYTSLEFVSFTNRTLLRAPNGINENEHVGNIELGFRTTMGDLSADIALFYTKINNRLASIFENGILVSKPFGSNKITGAELSLTYNPKQIRGLSIRSNLTLQKAVFSEFKIPIGRGSVIGNATNQFNVDTLSSANLFGNTLINEKGGNWSIDLKDKKLPGVPGVIWNSSINYEHNYFGIDFSSNVNANRYADPTEIIKYKTLSIINLGGYVKIPSKAKNTLRLGVQVKNLANSNTIQNIAGLSASELALGQKQKTPNWANTAGVPIWGQGYAQLPRRVLMYISVDF